MQNGEIIELCLVEGMKLGKVGMKGIVVNGNEEFQELYQLLVEQVGEQDAKDRFIAVEWIISNLFSKDLYPQNGFYLRDRFKPVSFIGKA